MKAPLLYPVIREKLKLILKEQHITYADLGARIGLTESGVKKLFTGKDLSLSRLERICAALNTSISDLIQDDPTPHAPELEFDLETQNFFLRNRACFNLFFLLLTDPKPAEEIIQEYRIPKKLALQYIRELEKRKLVKRTTNDRVVPTIREPSLFKYSGPFIKRLVYEWSHAVVAETLNKGPSKGAENYFATRLFYFLPDSHTEFTRSLSEVISEFALRSQRERKHFGRHTKPFRLLALVTKGHFVEKARTSD